MKSPSFLPRPLFALLTLGASLVTPLALAQDAPPPSEPSTPWQTPAPSEPAPATPAPPASDAATPPADSGETPVVPPKTPAPGLVYASDQTAAAMDRDRTRSDAAAAEPDDGKLRYHQDHWVGTVGFRVSKISSTGYDPFAESDALAQFSLGFGRTVLSAGNLSLAGLFLYDVGGHASEARGATTDLIVHRLTIGGEGRYHLIRQLFLFGRVAPGALHSIAKLEDISTGVQDHAARSWVFTTDLSAGASFEFTGFPGGSRKRRPSMWITLEGGYGIATESDLSMTPDDGDGPERAEPIELGSLGLGGPFMRGALVVTY